MDALQLVEIERMLSHGERLFNQTFESQDLTAFRMRRGRMLKATFLECRLDSVDASESYVPGAVFTSCIIVNSLFTHSYMRAVVFEKCLFESTDFSGAVFSEAVFRECTMVNCRFDQAEFSESILESINIQNSTFFLSDFTRVSASCLAPIRASIRGALLPAGV